MTTYVRGIDVSRYQPQVDWAKVKAAGVAFAVPKASQSNWADPMFATHWAGAKSAGLLRSAYHFFVPDMDPLKQAAAYLKALGSDPGDLPPVLDVEAKTTNPAQLAKDAEKWLAEVEKQLG
ncbi:MAG: glycoside hydrolase, family 25, partial [Anaerolineales bacterium]|nr:glycoside hydrolase, family 25 [Anaerolineales bacterium]